MGDGGVPPKASWGPGPWQEEPDRVEWVYLGVPCLMRRHISLGQWCGYVGVEPGHPWHGVGHDDIDANVHGGLTFASLGDDQFRMLSEPRKYRDAWWIGFDCGHCWDLAPGIAAMIKQFADSNRVELFPSPYQDTYRDVAYVKACVQELADQLIAARQKELTP